MCKTTTRCAVAGADDLDTPTDVIRRIFMEFELTKSGSVRWK